MTQIAGRDCSVCGKQILLSREGTFCVKCHQVMHRDCLAPDGVRCAACGTAWVEPETLYVRSERCPACGNRKIGEQQNHCRSCGTAMYWETEKDLADEKRRIHSVGIRRLSLAGAGLVIPVLGRMYREGRAVAKDPRRAVRLYRMAAIGGSASGRLGLAAVLMKGEGTKRDVVEAYKWLDLTAGEGSKPLTGLQEKLDGPMTAAQVADWVGHGKELEAAAGLREALAKLMTKKQIAEAKRHAAAVARSTATERGGPRR